MIFCFFFSSFFLYLFYFLDKKKMTKKTIGIIGVGSVGLTAIKWCLERNLKVTAYDKEEGCGGVWRWGSRHSPAYDSLCTNSSKTLMNLSDFPFDFETKSKFPQHGEILKYFTEYGKHFDLFSHVNWNHLVVSLQKIKLENKEQWEIRAWHNGELCISLFDYVLVCTGKLWSPNIPSPYKSLHSSSLSSIPSSPSPFPYTIHSSQYRNASPFQNQTVLIIGIGNSSLDIALELSKDPTITPLISCRRGTSVIPVQSPNGDPLDTKLATRFFQYTLSSSLRMLYLYRVISDVNEAFARNGLPTPPSGLFGPESPVANLKQAEEFLSQLDKGRIKLIGDVRIKKSQVGYHFEELPSNTTPSPSPPPTPLKFRANSVILCTGYNLGLHHFMSPQLQQEVVQMTQFRPSEPSLPTRHVPWLKLYKHILLPSDPTLCFLGFITSFGNESAIGEMQARWVTAMIAGLIPTPGKESITQDLRKLEGYLEKVKPSTSGFVRYVIYMDDLAKDLGAVPSVSLVSDPWLYFKLWFGAVVPTQYRLNGIDTHPEARKILSRL